MSTKRHIRRNSISDVTKKFEMHVEEVSRINIWRVFAHQRRKIIFCYESFKMQI